MSGSHRWTGWVDLMPKEHWDTYRRVLERAVSLQIPFSLGGALATATHTGVWRGTNDMDLYVLPPRRQQMVDLLDSLGLRDIQPDFPYDPSAIYRAWEGNAIVEVIWAMKNHRAEVDELWLSRAEEIAIRGLTLRVTPPEEIIWTKLYVMSRERCDWPDILNLVHFCGKGLDWPHLLNRLGDDAPLLAGLLCVLSWLSPHCLRLLPKKTFDRLGLCPPIADSNAEIRRWRASLLNPQEWFGPVPD